MTTFKEFFKLNWKPILFVGIVLFLVAKRCIEDNDIVTNGIITNATVYDYENSNNPKDYRTMSIGYYTVENNIYM